MRPSILKSTAGKAGLPLILAVVGSLAATAPLQAQQVSGVDVQANPTTVQLDVRGKSISTVRREVRIAARYVCNNAVANYEVDQIDAGWCAFQAADKAMGRYRTQLRRAGSGQLAAQPVPLIVALN